MLKVAFTIALTALTVAACATPDVTPTSGAAPSMSNEVSDREDGKAPGSYADPGSGGGFMQIFGGFF